MVYTIQSPINNSCDEWGRRFVNVPNSLGSKRNTRGQAGDRRNYGEEAEFIAYS
jgi:hypothetical protein